MDELGVTVVTQLVALLCVSLVSPQMSPSVVTLQQPASQPASSFQHLRDKTTAFRSALCVMSVTYMEFSSFGHGLHNGNLVESLPAYCWSCCQSTTSPALSRCLRVAVDIFVDRVCRNISRITSPTCRMHHMTRTACNTRSSLADPLGTCSLKAQC